MDPLAAKDDHYTILGLASNASHETVIKSYRRLALIHHPDKGGSTAWFQRLQHAYETIVDPLKQNAYNLTRQKAQKGEQDNAEAEPDWAVKERARQANDQKCTERDRKWAAKNRERPAKETERAAKEGERAERAADQFARHMEHLQELENQSRRADERLEQMMAQFEGMCDFEECVFEGSKGRKSVRGGEGKGGRKTRNGGGKRNQKENGNGNRRYGGGGGRGWDDYLGM